MASTPPTSPSSSSAVHKSSIFRPLSTSAYSALASQQPLTASASTSTASSTPAVSLITSDTTSVNNHPSSALPSPPLPSADHVSDPATSPVSASHTDHHSTPTAPRVPIFGPSSVAPRLFQLTQPPEEPQPPSSSLQFLPRDDLGDDDSFRPDIVSGYLPLSFNQSQDEELQSHQHAFAVTEPAVVLQPSATPSQGAVPSASSAPPLGPDDHLQHQPYTAEPAAYVSSAHRAAYRSQKDAVASAVNASRLLDSSRPDADAASATAQHQRQPSLPSPSSERVAHQPQQHITNRQYYQHGNFYMKSFQQYEPNAAGSAPLDLGDDDVYEHHEQDGDMNMPVGMAVSGHGGDLDDRGIDDFYDYDRGAHHEEDSFGHIPQGEYESGHVHEEDHRVDGIYNELDDIGDWIASTAPKPGTDLTKQLAKATSKFTTLGGNNATALATAALHSQQRIDDRRRDNLIRDKMDRATVENALDPRTRMILFRLKSRNRLRSLDGCVSTGKEANVYYATAASIPGSSPDANGIYPPNPELALADGSPDAPVAVKVFKTSILQFKDRERYVAGEFRFRRSGYQRGSNRKMVQQWAEKEFRNQKRLQEAGIPAPIPLLLKPPVLVMSFFGKDGWPAPRLKDAALSPNRLAKAYVSACMLMRRMFQVAHLVHGDLSEYNMLYWNNNVVIIDVSQSVEDDHQMALDFLRRDCANVNDFFRRNDVAGVLTIRELFDFITAPEILAVSKPVKDDRDHYGFGRNSAFSQSNGHDMIDDEDTSTDSDDDDDANNHGSGFNSPSVPRRKIAKTLEQVEAALVSMIERAASRSPDATRSAMHDDEVFLRSYIPRTLQEVEVREAHLHPKSNAPAVSEEVDSSLFARLTGLSISHKRERASSFTTSSAASASASSPPVFASVTASTSAAASATGSFASSTNAGSKRVSSFGTAGVGGGVGLRGRGNRGIVTCGETVPDSIPKLSPIFKSAMSHRYSIEHSYHAPDERDHRASIDVPSVLDVVSCPEPTTLHLQKSPSKNRIGSISAGLERTSVDIVNHHHQLDQTTQHLRSSSPCTSSSSTRGCNVINRLTDNRDPEEHKFATQSVESDAEGSSRASYQRSSGSGVKKSINDDDDGEYLGTQENDVDYEHDGRGQHSANIRAIHGEAKGRKLSASSAHTHSSYHQAVRDFRHDDDKDDDDDEDDDDDVVDYSFDQDEDNGSLSDNAGQSETSDESSRRRRRHGGNDEMMGMSKKEWKKKVKAENRERRENKVPKHVKKRKETLAKRRRGTK